jgi:WD40 repeat protein
MPTLSPTDALFSLHTSSIDSVPAKNAGRDSSSSAVTGVCFVQNTPPDVLVSDEDTDSDGDDDNFEPLQFKCSNLLLGRDHHKRTESSTYQEATHLSAASHTSLSGVVLASCHQDGTCKLWDLATRRCIVNDAAGSRDGPGLAVRRLDRMQQFVYQSRDVLGTVSLHDGHRPLEPILQLHTNSTTFCQMAPCHISHQYHTADDGATIAGERNLIALPTQEQSVAIIRDLRCDPTSNPTYRVDIGNNCFDSTVYHSRRNYGMLTSLGLCMGDKSQQLVLGCGMEDGSALFYDLRSKRSPWLFSLSAEENGSSSDEISNFMCHTKLGNYPVLSLDLSGSCSKDTGATSLVAVAGCAGDADELSELPEADQGTISTIKIKLASDLTDGGGEMKPSSPNKVSRMKATVRARKRTCSIESGGKIGVSVCRFRPDGRIFAVGGWDCRLRLFDRASAKPLAILHGHENTVVAVDWEENASSTGLLATGAGDGRICIYRVFPNTSLKR